MIQMTSSKGHVTWSATLAELDGATLSGFKTEDTLDVTDANPIGAVVLARYDNGTGALVVTRDGTGATVQLPAGLENTLANGKHLEFTVRTDRAGGSAIDMAFAAGQQNSIGTRAVLARANGGPDGTGVTVGVIGDSFNALGGMAQDVANGHLTPNINILADAASGLDEGRQMARVVQNIAPGATVDFVTMSYGGDAFTRSMQTSGAPVASDELNMANAIYRLAEAHVDVIVDDIGLSSGRIYQPGGALADAVAYARAQGIPLLTSANNLAHNYYENYFTLTETNELPHLGSTYAYAFNTGSGPSRYLQEITVKQEGAGGVVPIKIAWDQPAQGADYKLMVRVFAQVGGTYIPLPTTTGSGAFVTTQATIEGNDAIELTSINNIGDGGKYYIAVTSDQPATGLFKIGVNRQNWTNVFATSVANPDSGNIPGHSLDPNEITVGAVKWAASPYAQAQDPSLNRLPFANEPFSAYGPGRFLFNADGNRLATPLVLNKPDVSGVDAAQDDVEPGRDAAFFGTSAAAPSVAGVVALLLQANPHLTPDQVKTILQASALPLPSKAQGGAGLVQADLAVQLALPPSVRSITAEPDTNTGPLGRGHTAAITLHANVPLVVTAAANGSVPTLTLDNSGVATLDRAASSGADLVFRTTVGVGQSSPSLTVTGLELNGAIVQNAGTVAIPNGDLTTVSGADTHLAVAMQPETISVFRFYDSATGAHLYTASANERVGILTTRPDLIAEGQDGVGLQAVNPAAGDAYAAEVYRFFDTVHGTQVFTASADERDSIVASRPDLVFEPSSSLFMHVQAQAGDVPVWRFFSSADGSHLYTDSAAERAAILQTRPDLLAEGIAFYEPARAT